MSFIHTNIYQTIKLLTIKGLTREEAIREVEATLRIRIPNHIRSLIEQ